MQLDLFAHGRNVMLRNDVIAALRGGNVGAAREAWAVLAAEYPQDDLLAPLQTLLDTTIASVRRFPDHEGALEALRVVDTVVAPAAAVVFGAKEALAWLAPMWKSLASAASELPYDPQRPQAHAAFMSLQGGDWPAAEAHVRRIASWRRLPMPLAWMAEARFGQDGLDATWCFLAELAWISPSSFTALARRLEAPALHKLLDEFEAAFEPADESQVAWLPAWALIAEPGLAWRLRETQVCNNEPPERAARLVLALLALERQGRHGELIALRKRLRDMHAALFARYMSTR